MRTRRRLVVVVGLLVGIGLAGFAAWRLLLAPADVPPGVVAVSGRIERRPVTTVGCCSASGAWQIRHTKTRSCSSQSATNTGSTIAWAIRDPLQPSYCVG